MENMLWEIFCSQNSNILRPLSAVGKCCMDINSKFRDRSAVGKYCMEIN